MLIGGVLVIAALVGGGIYVHAKYAAQISADVAKLHASMAALEAKAAAAIAKVKKKA